MDMYELAKIENISFIYMRVLYMVNVCCAFLLCNLRLHYEEEHIH